MTLATHLRRVLAGAAILLTFAAPAFAQGGLNLSWNDCGTFGVSAVHFACDTNAGSHVLHASAVPGVDMPQFNGMEGTLMVQMQLDLPTLSDWWQLASGGCRFGALATSADFVSSPSSCADPWAGAAAGGMLYEAGYGSPNRARLRVIYALAQTEPLAASTEYSLFKVTIANTKTTGSGACAGCTALVCIVLTQVQLTQPNGVGDVYETIPVNSQMALWQPADPYSNCFRDPVRPSTWGQVKSLYRR